MVDLKRILSSSQLPTLPTVAVRLLEQAKNSETEIRDVIETIKTDPAISAKIVKAANSTYYAIRTEVKAIERAVPLLGTTVSTTLALSFSLTDDAMTRGPLVTHYQNYWKQSVLQAVAAETLGARLNPAQAPEFFLAGLLQDIGRLALLKAAPRDYLAVLTEAETSTVPLQDLEQAKLGIDHVLVGAKLMEQWKLPAPLVDAIRIHHDPASSFGPAPLTADNTLPAVIAVSAALGDYFCSSAKGAALERLRQLATDLFSLSEDGLQELIAACSQRFEQASELFQVDAESLGDPADLMVQANEQLVQLTLREHVASTQAKVQQEATEREKQELQTQNLALQQQALHDPLTRLYNRGFFDESVTREVGRTQRLAIPVAVIFTDIDHFKKLNDTYGHQFGDEVLKGVAKTLQASVRSSDIVARYGGEEFVVLVSQPTEKGVEKLAERLREQVAAMTFTSEQGPVKVTCSVGTAIAIPGRKEADLGPRLVAAADECLYEAKHGGRNRVCNKSLVSELDRQLLHQVTNHRFSRWLVAQQLLDVPSASRALLECPPQSARTGELAEMYGYLTSDQVAEVLADQEQTAERFGAIAIRLGYLTTEQLVHLLTLQQENPKQLASAIIRLGLMPPDRAAKALEQYVLTQVPRPNVVRAAAAAGR